MFNLKKPLLVIFELLILHFFVLLFLVTSNFKHITYEDPALYALVLVAAGVVAMLTAFWGYRLAKKKNARVLLIGLAFYVISLTILTHALTNFDVYFGVERSIILNISHYYGLFVGSILLLGLVLPLVKLEGQLVKFKFPIFLGFTLIYFADVLYLLMAPGISEKLANFVEIILVVTGILFFIIILFLIYQFSGQKSKVLINLIIGLSVVVNYLVVLFFGKEWGLIWWYASILMVYGFIVILFGVLETSRSVKEKNILDTVPIYARLDTKFLVVLYFLVISSIFTISYFNYTSSQKVLMERVYEELSILGEVKRSEVEKFLKENKGALLSAIDSVPADDKSLLYGENNNESVSEILKTIQVRGNFDRVDIVNIDGTVVYSTGNTQGKRLRFGDFLPGADRNYNAIGAVEVYDAGFSKAGYVGFVFTPENLDKQMFIIGMKNFQEVLGLVGNTINTGVFRESGNQLLFDTYFLNRQGVVLNDSAVDLRAILSEPIIRCKYNEEIARVYQNANKEEVLGVSKCLSNGWVVVVETRFNEALLSLEIIKFQMILVALIVMAVAFVLSRIFIGRIIKPLHDLSDAAEKIMRGHVNVELSQDSKDEIGVLANSFGEMVKKLVRINLTLEDQVHERTKDLNYRVRQLERFNKIAINRELKMIELKKEVKLLKQKENAQKNKRKKTIK